MNQKFPGIYETEYGNTAWVKNNQTLQAWDLDAGEWIPIELVDKTTFLRHANDSDLPSSERGTFQLGDV